MAIDWKSPENNERLLTCVYAWLQESNVTINHHRIAAHFGNGATYDAVQGNFRKFKQRIEDVKGGVEEAGVGVGGKGTGSVALSRAKGKKTSEVKVKAKNEEVEADVKEEESTELADGV
ncbi:hypothetical protein BLS_006490 [Venturia inaequalis]|uniref:Uncharacterized protein n=1 Tax=Venturia inaequalis TaxID=5025 RepID=A0A8H3V849_VENIN|nr:hypothetical protein BLS_006490 [Venturia inaequalis]